ncbi:MAG TPA: CBS domain-containing protein [Candidatus Binatia bacterium]|nr:CBS domain-containing protein [Candidatus Binatia bacterium]
MTLPIGLATLAGFLSLLVVLAAPHAPRLLRHGALPPRPRRYWLTLVVVRELGTAGAAAAAAWIALSNPGGLPAWAAAAVTGGVAYLAAEVIAPALGLFLPDAVTERVEASVQRLLAVLRRPLERPAVMVARWMAGAAGFASASLLQFAADGSVEEDEEAALDDRGRELLARVRAFRQRAVKAVMTPRVRIVSASIATSGDALLALLREQRFTRVPVYRGERDNVVGILYAKDLLGRDLGSSAFRLEPLLRPPLFVPVGMRTGEVFRELRRRKVHLALVVDEYGGVAGLVTMEDLLEELFGEIRDEYDEAEAP